MFNTVAGSVGVSVPIPMLPDESIRSLSSPLVWKEIVSLAGNLIFVFESPVWYIVSAISKLPCIVVLPAKVETPDTLTSSTYILLHSFAADPRSHVSLSSGMILESTSPPKTILSVSASPRVKVPPSNLVVPLTVRSPPT